MIYILLGKPIPHTQKKDRRDRLILKYSTSDKSHLGKQVKCSAKNHLGNAIDYAEIPGDIIAYIHISGLNYPLNHKTSL